MEYLDKIEQLFKANEIVLAVQLCKSQGYDLNDLLNKLCNIKENEYFILQGSKVGNPDGIYIFMFPSSRSKHKYTAWIHGDNLQSNDLDEVFDFISTKLYKLCK